MPQNRRPIEVVPRASRLVNSLRDIGYDFVHAVADLVDNSIDAGATEIDIDLRFEGMESWVRIADNGEGMSADEITEALRYGADRDYDAYDTGKFGLGLKTASFSQCRRLTVASRTSPRKKIEARVFDLEHIDRANRWEIHPIEDPDDERLCGPLQNRKGTVILWERLDRVLDYKVPWGERAKSGLLKHAERLELHLGMVFHRFLSGETRHRKRLRMTLNGDAIVEPWDPFARNEKHTVVLEPQEFELITPTGKGLVRYLPFILPPQERFSSPSAWQRMSGPEKWNRQQGFYIYRADRMIQSGGWSWMRTADEHTKLARASIDFYRDLDPAFKLNVAKARVSLPSELKEQLEPFVERLATRARAVYDGGGGPSVRAGGGRRMPVNKKQAADKSSESVVDEELPAENLRPARDALEEAAESVGEAIALERIMKALKRIAPEVARDLGW